MSSSSCAHRIATLTSGATPSTSINVPERYGGPQIDLNRDPPTRGADRRLNRNLSTSTIRHRGGWPLRSSRRLLAATLTLLSGGFQLAVALSVNLGPSACKHVLRCHVADRTVQPDVVIAIHILLNQAFCIFQ